MLPAGLLPRQFRWQTALRASNLMSTQRQALHREGAGQPEQVTNARILVAGCNEHECTFASTLAAYSAPTDWLWTYCLCLGHAKCVEGRSRLHLPLQSVLQVPVRLTMTHQQDCRRRRRHSQQRLACTLCMRYDTLIGVGWRATHAPAAQLALAQCNVMPVQSVELFLPHI
jgi:hypothetical protein